MIRRQTTVQYTTFEYGATRKIMYCTQQNRNKDPAGQVPIKQEPDNPPAIPKQESSLSSHHPTIISTSQVQPQIYDLTTGNLHSLTSNIQVPPMPNPQQPPLLDITNLAPQSTFPCQTEMNIPPPPPFFETLPPVPNTSTSHIPPPYPHYIASQQPIPMQSNPNELNVLNEFRSYVRSLDRTEKELEETKKKMQKKMKEYEEMADDHSSLEKLYRDLLKEKQIAEQKRDEWKTR